METGWAQDRKGIGQAADRELSGSRQRGMKLTQTSGLDELGGGYVPVLSTRYQAPLGVYPTVLTILALVQHR